MKSIHVKITYPGDEYDDVHPSLMLADFESAPKAFTAELCESPGSIKTFMLPDAQERAREVAREVHVTLHGEMSDRVCCGMEKWLVALIAHALSAERERALEECEQSVRYVPCTSSEPDYCGACAALDAVRALKGKPDALRDPSL